MIMAGTEALLFGPMGLVSGLAKTVGGGLIFLVLAVVSLPLGLFLRWAVSRVVATPLVGAAICGVSIGAVLIPVLHPAMYPGLSFDTAPLGLTVVHALAGLIGGVLWWVCETGCSGEFDLAKS